MGERLWLAAIWSRVGGVSIRTKIMGVVAVCVIFSALAMLWYTYHDVSSALREELVARGITISTSLAAQSRDLIVTDNQFVLYTLVRDQRSVDEDLAYAFILDGSGNVLAHTFAQGIPVELLRIAGVERGEPYRVLTLQTGDDQIQDVAVPILGGKAGVVRLGMSEASLRAAVSEHVWKILVWSALILVLGLSIAYGLASILSRPISRLSEAARAIGKGDFKWKAPIWARDEIGNLGAAFNEMSDQLKRKEEMRENLLARVISAQEDERKRIARELHDETSQALTSLMIGLKITEDLTEADKIREKTAELRTLAAQTLENVHHLALELRPSLLDDLGLVAALQRYLQDYSVNTNIKVDSHVSGFRKRRLPPDIESAIYRIIQEALTNVAKHARASNVSIILRLQDSKLVVVVEDDGVGFDVAAVMAPANEANLGLFGMYERVSLIGGKLTIESRPGAGTAIFVEASLNLPQEVCDD